MWYESYVAFCGGDLLSSESERWVEDLWIALSFERGE